MMMSVVKLQGGDAFTKSACFKGSRTSCDVIILGVFRPNVGRKNHIT